MAISLALAKQIGSMLIIMLFGFLTVRAKILSVENAKVLTKVVIYVAAPCCFIASFQINFSREKLAGLLLALICALIVHILFIALAKLLEKPLKLSGIERASAVYPNGVNLIIPLIIAVLGKEWVFYNSGFMIAQTVLMWTHGKAVVCEEKKLSLKEIATNINVIAIAIGLLLFLTGLRLPGIINSSFEAAGDLLGPLSMLVIGMLLGGKSLAEVFGDRRAYLVCFLRLIALPLTAVLLFGLPRASAFHPDGKNILLITVMCASSPPPRHDPFVHFTTKARPTRVD
jgi:predicted permease